MGIEQQLDDVTRITSALIDRMDELRAAPKELTKLQRKIQSARLRLESINQKYKDAYARAMRDAVEDARRDARAQIEQFVREEHDAMRREFAKERDRLTAQNAELSRAVDVLRDEAERLKEANALINAYPDLPAIVQCGNAAQYVAYKRAELAFIRGRLNAIDQDGKAASRIRVAAKYEVETILREASDQAEREFMERFAASRPVTGEAPES